MVLALARHIADHACFSVIVRFELEQIVVALGAVVRAAAMQDPTFATAGDDRITLASQFGRRADVELRDHAQRCWQLLREQCAEFVQGLVERTDALRVGNEWGRTCSDLVWPYA